VQGEATEDEIDDAEEGEAAAAVDTRQHDIALMMEVAQQQPWSKAKVDL
jgi:hypothetical protein